MSGEWEKEHRSASTKTILQLMRDQYERKTNRYKHKQTQHSYANGDEIKMIFTLLYDRSRIFRYKETILK